MSDLSAGEAGGGAAQRDDLPDGHHVRLLPDRGEHEAAAPTGSPLVEERNQELLRTAGAGSVAQQLGGVSRPPPERLAGEWKFVCEGGVSVQRDRRPPPRPWARVRREGQEGAGRSHGQRAAPGTCGGGGGPAAAL